MGSTFARQAFIDGVVGASFVCFLCWDLQHAGNNH